ncbi:hypothetical protein C8J56DRAFT_923677 [Mycena floridula]|nr:hypothetical protein C8J56DRAFT_923677 [Mycena floridula]
MFSPFELPQAICVLVTDEISSPADFFLHETVASHFKKSRTSKCIILSVAEGLTKWQAIAAKSNLNLGQRITAGSLRFVNVVGAPFSNTFQLLTSILDSDTTVILDDVATLEWIGYSALDVTRFCRAIRALCSKMNATLILRHHIVTSGDPDDLFRQLLQICTYHVDVRPLASGRSGTVSGEVALHPGPNAVDSSVKPVTRSCAIQYRLTDAGAVFFERGTSSSVL